MEGTKDPNRQLLNGIPCAVSCSPSAASRRSSLTTATSCSELFADLSPSGRGRPSIPADVITIAMVCLTGHDSDAGAKSVIAWDDPVASSASSLHGGRRPGPWSPPGNH